MNTNKTWKTILLVILSIVPLVYLSIVWNKVPDTVPVHFNADFEPNSFKPKEFLWAINGSVAAVAILVYFLLKNMHRIDPKRSGKTPSVVFDKLAVGLILFLTLLNQIALMASTGHPEIVRHMLLPVVGLLLAFLGNFMNNVKPNYFVGFRTPWTLSSDENWRKTHHFTGRLWFVAGIVFCICSFIFSGKIQAGILIAVIIVLILLPLIYSYNLYKKSQKA